MKLAGRDAGESVPGSTRHTDNANLHLGWQPAQGQSITIGYRYLNGERTSYPEQSGGPQYAASDALDHSHYTEDFFSLGWTAHFKMDRNMRGVFADISATPLPALLLHGGLRYDDPQGFDKETSAQAGVKFIVDGGVTFAANWGEAYKLPSLFALGHPLVGNADLQPEQNKSLDLGVSWQPLAALSLRTQATYADIDIRNEDTVLTGRPQWTTSVVAQWQIAEQWNTALD